MNLLEYQDHLIETFDDQSPASRYRKWFRQTGKHFSKHEIDKQKSRDLAKKNNAIVKQCYLNSARAVMSDFSLRYFEGYVNFRGIPIEHAFLVDKNNKVVDLTFGIDPKIRIKKAKRYGIDLKNTDHEFGLEYFGVEIPQHKLWKILSKQKVYGMVSFIYWGELE